jgi:hypothetical protein
MNPSSIIFKAAAGQRVAPALAYPREAHGPIAQNHSADRS